MLAAPSSRPGLAPRARGALLLGTFAAVAIVLVCLRGALQRGAVADFYPINGTFQIHDAIARLAAGQWMGRDFDAYLGLGPTGLVRLATWGFGADYLGTVRAAQFTSLLAHAGAVALLAALVGLRTSRALVLGLCAAILATERAAGWIPEWIASALETVTYPLHALENSALGLRSVLPFLAVGALLVLRRACASDRAAAWSSGAVAGACLVWSNDYGPPTCAAVLALALLAPAGRPEAGGRAALRRALRLLVASLLSAAAVVTLATGGALGAWVEFNLSGVLRDQSWYFVSVAEAHGQLERNGAFALTGALLLAAWVWKSRTTLARPGDPYVAVVIAATLLAGLVSTRAHDLERYWFPLVRVSAIAGAGLALIVAAHALRRIPRIGAPMVDGLARAGSALAAVLAVGGMLAWGAARGRIVQASGMWDSASLVAAPELGGALSGLLDKTLAIGRELRAELDADGVPPERRMASLYVGALDTLVGARSNARVDYAIHALGPDRRRAYFERFLESDPRYVTTLREDFTWFEGWNQAMNWPVYREILRRYDRVDRTSQMVVWRRREQTRELLDIPVGCRLVERAGGGPAIDVELGDDPRLADQRAWIVEVAVEYEIRGGLMRRFARPFVRYPRPNEMPMAFGIPPYEERCVFPLRLTPGGQVRVDFGCVGIDDGETPLSIRAASARVIGSGRLLGPFRLRVLRAASRDDGQVWVRGVMVQGRAAFHVVDATDLEGVAPGQRLRFARSGVRTVLRVQDRAVEVDGALLDPAGDGWPRPIEVLDP